MQNHSHSFGGGGRRAEREGGHQSPSQCVYVASFFQGCSAVANCAPAGLCLWIQSSPCKMLELKYTFDLSPPCCTKNHTPSNIHKYKYIILQFHGTEIQHGFYWDKFKALARLYFLLGLLRRIWFFVCFLLQFPAYSSHILWFFSEPRML